MISIYIQTPKYLHINNKILIYKLSLKPIWNPTLWLNQVLIHYAHSKISVQLSSLDNKALFLVSNHSLHQDPSIPPVQNFFINNFNTKISFY